MRKKLIFGLDLSFSSTGITVNYLEETEKTFDSKKLEFYRVVFDDESRVNEWHLKHITNVNQYTYKLPKNININDLLIDENTNDIHQLSDTLKSMIVTKRIMSIIIKACFRYKPDDIYFGIENFIMPTFGGCSNQQGLTSLIMYQGMLRDALIKYCLTLKKSDEALDGGYAVKDFKITVVSPSENKKSFTGDGKSDKKKMIKTFYDDYDGNKLIPKQFNQDVKIDDIVDSFSLMVFVYRKLIKQKLNLNSNSVYNSGNNSKNNKPKTIKALNQQSIITI